MDNKKKDFLGGANPFLTLGLQLAVTVIAFFFLGKFLDEYFSTSPWLLIVFVLIGVVGSLIQFVKTVQRLNK